MSIVAEVEGFLQVFSDGSVKRFTPPISGTSSVFDDGFKSKDVVVDASKSISARIYVPQISESLTILPVVIYFHGGGFCFGSTTWSTYHDFLGGLCVRSRSIVVSVDYRLAPEYRIPAAYDDCLYALNWIEKFAPSEPWLEKADLSGVFLSGESAGANIVHHVALSYVKSGEHQVKIKGLLIIQPSFGSQDRLEHELDPGMQSGLKVSDTFWFLSLPEGSNRDHPACNFEKENSEEETEIVQWNQVPATAVFLAGLDLLKQRGMMYVEFLRKKGVKEVQMTVEEGQPHVYQIFFPKSDAAQRLQTLMGEFIERHT